MLPPPSCRSLNRVTTMAKIGGGLVPLIIFIFTDIIRHDVSYQWHEMPYEEILYEDWDHIAHIVVF